MQIMKHTKSTSTERCSYCKQRADWKASGITLNKFACEEHKTKLQNEEKERHDDGHMSEGDHQSWGRL